MMAWTCILDPGDRKYIQILMEKALESGQLKDQEGYGDKILR
jgi:hypothetical protein